MWVRLSLILPLLFGACGIKKKPVDAAPIDRDTGILSEEDIEILPEA